MSEPIRLAKYLAETLSCSRREAELYIVGGWVSVDGEVIQEPQFRVRPPSELPRQTIVLHPDASLAPIELVTILMNHVPDRHHAVDANTFALKNRSADDVSGIHPLKRHFSKLTAVLPLQANASGLLIYTQDWRVERKLTNDAATVEQEYIVEVAGVENMPPNGLKQLNSPLMYNGRVRLAAKVSWQNETRLRVAIKGPEPGQIQFLCQSVNLTVRQSKRIRVGKVSMGKMPAGQWRYLPPQEKF